MRSGGAGSSGAPGHDAITGHGAHTRYGWAPQTEQDARLEIIDSEDKEFFEESGRRDAERLLPFLEPGFAVLDLGCGIGRIAMYMAPHCQTLWAVDASPRMLEMAGTRLAGLSNVKYAQCLDTKVPEVVDESIDLVYSIIVLQHLEKEDAFLLTEDVVRMLRPGGLAFLTWPNLLDEANLEAFVQGARRGEATNNYRARLYTTHELELLLPRAGFSSVEIRDEPNIVTICRR